MNRLDFIMLLNEKLYVLNEEDKKDAISYYLEIIDDKVDRGISEEEAVSSLGNIDDLVKVILDDEYDSSKNKTDEKPHFTEDVKSHFGELKADFLNGSNMLRFTVIIGIISIFFLQFPSFGIITAIAVIWSIVYFIKNKHQLNALRAISKIVIIFGISTIIFYGIAIFLFLIGLLYVAAVAFGVILVYYIFQCINNLTNPFIYSLGVLMLTGALFGFNIYFTVKITRFLIRSYKKGKYEVKRIIKSEVSYK